MSRISIIILSHNRPRLLPRMLESISVALDHYAPRDIDIELIVSDNSTENVFIDEFACKFCDFNFIDNRHLKSSSDHYNYWLSNCASDYLMIIHDDDEVGLDFFKFIDSLDSEFYNEDLLAIGFNAVISKNLVKTSELFSKNTTSAILSSPRTLYYKYFWCRTITYTPFPFYVYNLQRTRSLKLYDNVKYSDVLLLAQLLNSGKILIKPDIMGIYRFHGENDSAQIDISAYFALLKLTLLLKFTISACILFSFIFKLVLNRLLGKLLHLFRSNFS